MHPQTYSVLEALGSPSSIALVLELLQEPSGLGVDELSKRTEINKSTVSRHLKELALAGVLSRPRWTAYAVTCPDETRLLLQASSTLASAVIAARQADEKRFAKGVRKSGIRAERGDSAGVTEESF